MITAVISYVLEISYNYHRFTSHTQDNAYNLKVSRKLIHCCFNSLSERENDRHADPGDYTTLLREASAQPSYRNCETRPLQFWKNWELSVFGHLCRL